MTMKISTIRALVIATSIGSMALSLSNVANAAEKNGTIVVNAPEGRIPVGEFVKKPNMRSPRLSPDGSKLAYRAAKDGREILVIQDLSNAGSAPKIVLAAEEAREAGQRTLNSYRWLGNGFLLLSVALREDLGGGPGDFGRLIAYDLSTGKLIQQAWDGAGGDATNVLYLDRDKGTYLLERDSLREGTERFNFPEVVNVDAKTGKYATVQRTNPFVGSWVADGKGVVRAGYGSNGENGKFRMMYRGNADEQFKTVFNQADGTFTQNPPTPQIFLDGGDTAYAMSRKDGFDKIYKIDMKTMALSEPVFSTPNFDVQGFSANYNQNDIDSYTTFDGEEKTVFVEPIKKQIQAFMDDFFGKNQSAIVSIDKNNTKAVIDVGGTTKNDGFYLYDIASGDIKLINWSSSTLKDTPLNTVKAEWYETRDGKKIQAIVTYPRHRTGSTNLPVVVMPHGGPFGVLSATNNNEPWSQPLAEAGYVVVQPNYRGSGGYGRDFEKEGRKPDGYGVKMQDDLNDILTYFGKKGVIDPKRACIMGWSYGGYAAARGAQRDPDVWKCAVAGAGIYDFPMMKAYDAENLGTFNAAFQATSDDLVGISSARHTDSKWAPILVVAGLRDARIPIEQPRTLISRLKASGKKEGSDFRYIEQPQGTHNLPYDDVHIQWIEESEKWMQRFNPAYVPTDADKEPPFAKFGK